MSNWGRRQLGPVLYSTACEVLAWLEGTGQLPGEPVFSMDNWDHRNEVCIGGAWERALEGQGEDVSALDYVPSRHALFYPGVRQVRRLGRSPYLVTSAQAARVFKHYLATGRVDWAKAKEEGE